MILMIELVKWKRHDNSDRYRRLKGTMMVLSERGQTAMLGLDGRCRSLAHYMFYNALFEHLD